MLAFSFSDSHIHLIPYLDFFKELHPDFSDEDAALIFPKDFSYKAVACAHGQLEFARQERLAKIINSCGSAESGLAARNIKIVPAFGMHPQNPLVENADFLERLLRQGRIASVGETGFDFFPEVRADEKRQEEAWRISLELAEKYGAAIVIHCRKAMANIFRDAALLKKIRAVVFHSFMGSVAEAKGFLKRGVNAFFSFGKPLLQGDKSAASCVAELPAARLLFETDAPWQTLKGEKFTPPCDILKVYEKAALIRSASGAPCATSAGLADVAWRTFDAVFCPRL